MCTFIPIKTDTIDNIKTIKINLYQTLSDEIEKKEETEEGVGFCKINCYKIFGENRAVHLEGGWGGEKRGFGGKRGDKNT